MKEKETEETPRTAAEQKKWKQYEEEMAYWDEIRRREERKQQRHQVEENEQ